ncbi:MAG: hypothetical protein HDT42_01045 [Ruminococcaceae bacterium]|nr:hypothetical protein [Oscillospiraceae bacterium]
MECALWLNRRKIRDAAEIPQNLDIASLRGYFLAGSLAEWLREHNGADYASELEKIPTDCPELNSRISEIFGGTPIEGKPLNGASAATTAPSAVWRGSAHGLVCSFGGSFNGSFGGSFGSYGGFANIWNLFGSFGSFYLTSGGFHEWEWEWLFGFGGSFGSFSFTSGGYESALKNLLTQLKFGSFSSFGSFLNFPWNLEEMLGSYRGFPMMDEYDLILLQTLLNCPLDRYGYGIHII